MHSLPAILSFAILPPSHQFSLSLCLLRYIIRFHLLHSHIFFLFLHYHLIIIIITRNHLCTFQVEVTRENAQNLLATASLLEMMPIQRACAKFMEMQLDVNNCIGIHDFACAHSLLELAQKAREFIEKNFTQVSVTEEFLHLSFSQLLELLGSDELNVEKEEVRLTCVGCCSW